jgi:putative ATP-dependent endonuclease of OLD family
VGFLAALLDRYVTGWRDQGIYISDATGNDNVLSLLEALSSGGVKFAGFADFEGRFEGRWQTLRQRMGNLLFQWQQGCLEENIIPLIPPARIFQLIEDPAAEKTGMRLRTLADRLEIEAADFDLISDRPDQELKNLIVAAATGQIPEHLANAERTIKNPYKGHASVWFKSVTGGRELADKVHALETWPLLQARMVPFLNAIRTSVGLVPLPEVEQ